MIDEDELEAHARATQQAAWSYNFQRQDKCPHCKPHEWHGVARKSPSGPQPCPCPTAWEAAS